MGDLTLASTLSDVASLWMLGLVVLACLCLVLFRKPLTSALSDGRLRLRHKDTELEIVQPPLPVTEEEGSQESENGPPIENTLVRASATQTSNGQLDLEPKSIYDLYSAVHAKKEAEAKEIFEELQRNEKDTAVMRKNEVAYVAARAIWGGDAKAIAELETLSTEPDAQADALNWAGAFYQNMGLPDKAVDYHRRALEVARTAADQREISRAASGLIRAYGELAQQEAAIRVVGSTIEMLSDASERAHLYTTLADLYTDVDWFLRAVTLAKAVEEEPNDVSLQFRYAYALSQAGYTKQSLTHYLKAVMLDPKHVYAQNNLGVAYEMLDMPIKSILAYEASHGEGNTLAAANLALRYLNAGFVTQAKDLLRDAATSNDVHENVGKNMARAVEDVEAEETREKTVTAAARPLDEFFRDLNAAWLKPSVERVDLAGAWTAEDGDAATVEHSGQDVTINWTTGKTPRRVTGKLKNRALPVLNYFVEEMNFPKYEKEFASKGIARGYLNEGGDRILVQLPRVGQDHELLHFERRASSA